MKARITHLKAPWPLGAVVGAVVLFDAGAVPSWAAGKCVPVGDDEAADLVVARPSAEELAIGAGGQFVGSSCNDDGIVARVEQEFAAKLAELQAKVQDLTGQNEALQTAKAEAESKLAELQAKVDAAAKTKGK